MTSFKAILGFLFMLLVAGVAVLSVLGYQRNQSMLQTSLLVRCSQRVIQKADEVSAAFTDARLSVNIMIIRRDTSGKSRYVAAINPLPLHVKALRGLLSGNDRQQERIDSLEVGLSRFQVVSDSLIRMATGARSADSLSRLFIQTVALRDSVALGIKAIKDAENILLSARESANAASVTAFTRIFLYLLTGIAILLISTFVVIRFNFNKRMRIQQDLERSNLLFEKVFHESPISIVISELETGRILNCNRVYANMVNYALDDLVGKTAVELGIFANHAQREEIMSGAKNAGMKQAEVYIRPKGKDPVYVSIHTQAVPLYDRACLLTAIMDLTTHRQAEEEIKKALAAEIELNELRSNFVTLASHEFRTPLTTILSSVFLLQNYSHGEGQEKVMKHLARISSSVNILTSMLDQFLSISKIEQGQALPRLEPVDLPEYLESICQNLRAFTKAGQVIHYSHTGDNEVKTDTVLLASIVSNLVNNSIKYSAENAPIYVSSTVNSVIHLAVTDEGMGISPEDQQHLFERFYRGSNAANIQGTGLGLHIMKHYVDMLNGSVAVESEPGKGTRIVVTFDRT